MRTKRGGKAPLLPEKPVKHKRPLSRAEGAPFPHEGYKKTDMDDTMSVFFSRWWTRQASNLRQSGYEPGALPTELRVQQREYDSILFIWQEKRSWLRPKCSPGTGRAAACIKGLQGAARTLFPFPEAAGARACAGNHAPRFPGQGAPPFRARLPPRFLSPPAFPFRHKKISPSLGWTG